MRRGRIWRLAWPSILENILITAIWTVDTAMVGRIGAEALSSVGLGGQFVFTAVWVLGALGIGASSMVARYIGAGDREHADRVAAQAVLLAVIAGLMGTAIGWPLAPRFLSWVTRDAVVHAQGMTYFRTLIVTLPLMICISVGNASLRGAGNTRVPLLVSAVANGSNIILDYVLIFGAWGAPRLGVYGAALASAIAQGLGFVTLMVILFSGRVEIDLTWVRLARWRSSIVKQILRLSLPAALEEGQSNLARMLFVIIISSLGTAAYAANTVAVSIESLSFMPGWGFAVASSALVGQALGAGERDEALATGWEALRLALPVMSLVGVIFALFPGSIVRIFTNDPAVTPLAMACIRVAALEQPAIALEMVLAGSLRGAGDTRTPLGVSLIGNWLIRLPLAWIVVRHLGGGIAAVWLVTAVDWSVRGGLLVWRYAKGKWAVNHALPTA